MYTFPTPYHLPFTFCEKPVAAKKRNKNKIKDWAFKIFGLNWIIPAI
jgi:hypothetical protein